MTNEPVDVVVIGSGIGGLCCAALCARAGRSVLVMEAHHQPGGGPRFSAQRVPLRIRSLALERTEPLAQQQSLETGAASHRGGDLPMIQYRDWDAA